MIIDFFFVSRFFCLLVQHCLLKLIEQDSQLMNYWQLQELLQLIGIFLKKIFFVIFFIFYIFSNAIVEREQHWLKKQCNGSVPWQQQ